jgi:hypothetical protein
MDWWNAIVHFGARAWNAITGLGSDAVSASQWLWHAYRSLASGIVHIYTSVLTQALRVDSLTAALLTGNWRSVLDTIRRLDHWLRKYVITPLEQLLLRLLGRERGERRHADAWLLRRIKHDFWWLKGWARYLTRIERNARIAADKADRVYAHKQMIHALQVVQREAASGYKMNTHQRVTIIGRVLSIVVRHDPLLKDAAEIVTKGIVLLLEVDDPLLRFGVTAAVKFIISHLGINKPVGHLLQHILEPLMGQGPPKDLHDVIADICGRLNSMETEWATFMADGGPQILEAGKQWDAITSLLGDAAMVGMFTVMVAEPRRFAADITHVASPFVHETTRAINALLS